MYKYLQLLEDSGMCFFVLFQINSELVKCIDIFYIDGWRYLPYLLQIEMHDGEFMVIFASQLCNG